MHHIRKVANASRYSYSFCSWAAATPNKTINARDRLPSLRKEGHGNNEHAALCAGTWSASWTEAIEASGFPGAETEGRPVRAVNGERAARHYCSSAGVATSGSGQRDSVVGVRVLIGLRTGQFETVGRVAVRTNAREHIAPGCFAFEAQKINVTFALVPR